MTRDADTRAGGGRRQMRRKLLAVLVAGCFGAGAAHANPLGPQVVNGQAGFATQGNTLTVTNTPGAIINWQSFSINQGETTRFLQQNANSAVLNRITGQDPSQILGALQSNGRVFLVNPNGILFGQGAQVDVNGLVASTLNISDSDFLAGKLNFHAGTQAAGVSNQGTIATPSGGQVYLIAPSVENSGIINAPDGTVLLAAGHSVNLADSTDPALQVVVSAPDDQALNLGSVVARSGRIGIYGALVSQRGIVNADSAVAGADGKIVLKASHSTTLEAGSLTSARGAGKGGTIELLGDEVALNGDTRVDASGASGGGTVLIGGDAQGANPAVQNAKKVFVGRDATVAVDATDNGDGGKLVLWSDRATRAYGTLSARGGAQGGNGGSIETSGHTLDIAGLRADAGAPHGKRGSWLLDPYNIGVTIDSPDTALSDVDQFTDNPDAWSYISPATLGAANADVMLQAQNDITFQDPLTMSNSNVGLTAEAGNSIYVYGGITTNGGKVTLAMNYGPYATGNGVLYVGGNGITTNGADITLLGDQMALTAPINAGAGRVTLAPATSGTAIELGPEPSGMPNTLELSNTALSYISSDSTLTIGDATNGGPIHIGAGLNGTFPSLSLLSAGTITQAPGATLGGGLSLRLQGSSITLLEDNPTGRVAAKTTSGDFLYHSVNGISVESVDGLNGISVPALSNILLYSNKGIGQNSAISGGGLIAIGSGAISLLDPANNVNRFAAALSAGSDPGSLDYYNQGNLEIGTVSTAYMTSSGVSTDNLSIRLMTGPHAGLTISQPVVAGTTGAVDLTADALTLNSTVAANEVSIRPHSSGRPITIGSSNCHETDTADGSCLAVTQLWRVIAPTIGIGQDGSDVVSGTDGNTLSGPIYVEGITNGVSTVTDRNVLTTRIGLLSGAGVSQGGTTGIDVQDLGAVAGGSGSVELTNAANKVANLAGKTQGGDFAFANSGNINVTTLSDANAGSLPSVDQSPSQSSLLLASGSVVSGPGQVSTGSGDYSLPGINVGSGNITLKTPGAISGGGVAGNSLTAVAGNGIDLSTQVASLSAINTDNSGTSAIHIVNTGVLTLNDVKQAGSAGGAINISNYGALTLAFQHSVSSGSGAITLQAHSPLTVNGTVTSGSGDIELDAVSSSAGNDTLTINGNVSTSGSVMLQAGTALTLNGLVSGSSVTRNVNGVVTTGTGSCAAGSTSASCTTIAANTSTVVSVTTTAVNASVTQSSDIGVSVTDGTTAVATDDSATDTTSSSDSGKTDGQKDGKKDEKKDVGASEKDKGAKKDEPPRKMYCN